jgi:hypothetical protein
MHPTTNLPLDTLAAAALRNVRTTAKSRSTSCGAVARWAAPRPTNGFLKPWTSRLRSAIRAVGGAGLSDRPAAVPGQAAGRPGPGLSHGQRLQEGRSVIGYAMAKHNGRELARRWPEHNRRRHPEGGHEKLWGRCQEWMPMDEDFFSFIPAQGHYRSWCLFFVPRLFATTASLRKSRLDIIA